MDPLALWCKPDSKPKQTFLLSLYYHWFCVTISYHYITNISGVLFVLNCTYFQKKFVITFYILDYLLFCLNFFFLVPPLTLLFILVYSFCTSEYSLLTLTFLKSLPQSQLLFSFGLKFLIHW